ncbi:MAG: CRISPR-associated endonuclease Cas1 [Elusimicrobia bacterium]|nr:CRISPR-associated endonuclease Cas1 [Elusimicrobiota bacterium]
MLELRSLNEFVYCPRLFHLEYVQGLFRESADTLSGSSQHEKAQKNRPRVRKAGTAKEEPEPEKPAVEEPSLFTKSFQLSSEKLNITGRLDAVESDGNSNNFTPVEAKHSAGPQGSSPFILDKWTLSSEAYPNDQIQLCAQGLLLRENRLNSDYGFVYYRASKTRAKIDFSDDLINAALHVIASAEKVLKAPVPPSPLLDSPKCVRCSLNVFCLPDEINRLAGKIGEPRLIIPGRDDTGVLYVLTQGAHIHKKGEEIIVEANGEKIMDVPLKDVSHAVLVGHVQISTETLHLFMQSGRTVAFLSAGGRLLGMAGPPLKKNIGLRAEQFRKFDNSGIRLLLSREIVSAKIENQRTIIRRNSKATSDGFLSELKELAVSASGAENLETLLGLEGRAARVYFEILPNLVSENRKEDEATEPTFACLPGAESWKTADNNFFRMIGRTKRPPKDPVNAMLSFGYALLARDFISALFGAGLDPYFGFYHAMEAGRPALALDLMEPFRPIIVDSTVLRLINTGEIKKTHFLCAQTQTEMTKEGRTKFIAAYERRMDELVTHPIFGYRISYRRIIDVECRLLGRFLEGEIKEYKPLRTR